MNEIPKAGESSDPDEEPFHLPPRIASVLGHRVPNGARPVGYAALAAAYAIETPAPDTLFAISERHTPRLEGRWSILTPRYRQPDTLTAPSPARYPAAA